MEREIQPGAKLSRPPTDVALVEDMRLPDAYEQKFMGDDGIVLHRGRHHAPWRLHAAFALFAGIVVMSAVSTGHWLALTIALPIVALIWLLCSVLRVTVSNRHVNVQYGLFGREIPIAAIESSEVIVHDWVRGLRVPRSRASGRVHDEAVRVAWRDRKGRRCVTLIGSRHAAVLAARIERARSMLPASKPPPALLGPK